MFWVPVWYNHLGKRQPPDRITLRPFVIESYVWEHQSFAVVEANVQFPVGPTDVSAIHLERDAFGLSDVYRFEVRSETTFGLDSCGMIVVWRCLVERPSYRRHIDVDNFLGIRIVDGAEVQWVGVLAIVHMGAVVH
jgi:hypothetical protein